MYNWVNNFLLDRKIQVKVGTEYSNVHGVENGTLQGSVCSPLLFNIMINVFFFLVDQGVGKSLYADDGALFISCRNVFFLKKSSSCGSGGMDKTMGIQTVCGKNSGDLFF